MVAVEEALSRSRPLDSLKRGCAIACPRGQYAADLIVPAALGSEGGRRVEDFRAKDMTAAFVQVRNLRQQSRMSADEVDEIFSKIQNLAHRLAIRGEYIYVLVPVFEQAVTQGASNIRRHCGKAL